MTPASQGHSDHPDRCAYCGAALNPRCYFCLACATPYKDEALVLPTVHEAAPTEGELIAQRAPAVLPIFWTYFCLVVASAVGGYVLFRGGHDELVLIFEIVLLFLVTAVLAGVYWRSLAVQFRRLGLLQPAGFLSVLAVAPLLGLNWTYSSLLARLLPHETTSLLQKLREAGVGRGGLIVLLCVLPALTEEVAFRGLLQHWLQVAIRPARAVIVAAALFTVLHFSILSAPYIFLVGLLLGWAKWKTGSLYPSILIHFLHNLAVVELFRT
jgi:membrane protease YdiL (CAAX protease family)